MRTPEYRIAAAFLWPGLLARSNGTQLFDSNFGIRELGGSVLKYDFEYRVEYPGRRPGEHHKNAEEGEESEEALT
jgi:hypothetical protein